MTRYVLIAPQITTIHNSIESANEFKEELIEKGVMPDKIKILEETEFKSLIERRAILHE